MFDEFKAKHVGLGPVQSFLNVVTDGALGSRAQRAAVGAQMDDLLGSVKTDDTLPQEFKDQAAGMLAHGVYNVSDSIKNIAAVRAEAHVQHTIGGAFAPVMAGAQSLYDAAQTSEDRSIMSSLLANVDAARKLAADPQTRQTGMQLFGQVAQDVANYTTTAKTNAINASVKADEIARDLDKEQAAGFTNARDNLQKQSTPYIGQKQAWSSIQNLASLKTPTSFSDQNLMRAVATVLNPTLATRPGEDPGDAYYSALDSVPGLGAAVKYALTHGTELRPEDRQTMIYLAAQRMGEANADQTERNTEALAEGKARNLPDKYQSLLAIPIADLGALGQASEPREAAPNAADSTQGPPAAGKMIDTAPPDSTGTMVGTAIKDAVTTAVVETAKAADAALGGPISAATRRVQDYQRQLRERNARQRLPQDDITETQPSAPATGGGFP